MSQDMHADVRQFLDQLNGEHGHKFPYTHTALACIATDERRRRDAIESRV